MNYFIFSGLIDNEELKYVTRFLTDFRLDYSINFVSRGVKNKELRIRLEIHMLRETIVNIEYSDISDHTFRIKWKGKELDIKFIELDFMAIE